MQFKLALNYTKTLLILSGATAIFTKFNNSITKENEKQNQQIKLEIPGFHSIEQTYSKFTNDLAFKMAQSTNQHYTNIKALNQKIINENLDRKTDRQWLQLNKFINIANDLHQININNNPEYKNNFFRLCKGMLEKQEGVTINENLNGLIVFRGTKIKNQNNPFEGGCNINLINKSNLKNNNFSLMFFYPFIKINEKFKPIKNEIDIKQDKHFKEINQSFTMSLISTSTSINIANSYSSEIIYAIIANHAVELEKIPSLKENFDYEKALIYTEEREILCGIKIDKNNSLNPITIIPNPINLEFYQKFAAHIKNNKLKENEIGTFEYKGLKITYDVQLESLVLISELGIEEFKQSRKESNQEKFNQENFDLEKLMITLEQKSPICKEIDNELSQKIILEKNFTNTHKKH